jgi:hypothetical protein
MICDHYKQDLLELAAAGAESAPKLHAHLQACSSCRSAFENERSLLASIDSCLRSSANAEVPPSFIPTVRALVQQEVPQESFGTRAIKPVLGRLQWVPALAAATIILFIFARLDRWVKSPSTGEQFVTQQARSPVARQITATKPPQGSSQQITSANRNSLASKAVITLNKNSAQTENRAPEIIVPPDQEVLLARYADQFRRQHQPSSTLLTEIDPDQTGPLRVPLIQIAELDVKPLMPLAGDQKYDQESDVRQK